jgi:hypothetical protein
MPLPLIVIPILELATLALTAYEVSKAIKEIYDSVEKYKGTIEQAKKEIEKQIKGLVDEIDSKIKIGGEKKFLETAADEDPQSEVTKKGTGTGVNRLIGDDKIVVVKAIQQKVPFRQVIGMVCEKANAMPIISLRRKPGAKMDPKTVVNAKREIIQKLLVLTAEEMAGEDIDDFIMVRLKQLAANLMFEFIDNCLEWKSPLKCEVSFGPDPMYADHPLDGANATKLKRTGMINPFYPAPHRSKGSVAADLVITEYRAKPAGKANIFAIVEIKFPGDKIEAKQFRQYGDLLKAAAKAKTIATASTKRRDGKHVKDGGRLSLFRFPDDMPAKKEDGKKKSEDKDKSTKSHGAGRRK